MLDLTEENSLETFELGNSPQIVQKRVLDNGLVLFTNRKVGIEGKVHIDVGFNFGSADEDPSDNGVAHLIEHTVFRGNDDLSAMAIIKALERDGGKFNAGTSEESTEYDFDVNVRNVPRVLKTIYEMLIEPNFGPRKLATEKGIVLHEIADYEHDFEDILGSIHMKLLLGDHPVAKLIRGTKDTVEGLTKAALERYHRKHYTASNMAMAIIGDIDDRCIDEAIRIFSAAPKGERNKRLIYPATPHVQGYVSHRINDSDWQCCSVGAKLTDGTEDVNLCHPEIYVMSFINSLLGSGTDTGARVSGRMNVEIREKLGLVYSVTSDYGAGEDYGIYDVSFSRTGDSQPVLDIIYRELDRLRREPVSAEEFQSVLDFMLDEYTEELILRDQLCNSLVGYELTQGGIREYACLPQRYRDVTPERIMAFAQKYMNIDLLSVAKVESVRE